MDFERHPEEVLNNPLRRAQVIMDALREKGFWPPRPIQ